MNLDLQLDQEEVVTSSALRHLILWMREDCLSYQDKFLCVHDQCLLQSMHQRDEESEILVQQVNVLLPGC
jgi:hypothetical protein